MLFFFFFPVWHFRARYQTQGVILYTMSNICCGSFHRQATVMLFFVHSFIHSQKLLSSYCGPVTMAKAKERTGPWDPGFLQDRWITTNGPGLVSLSSYYLNPAPFQKCSQVLLVLNRSPVTLGNLKKAAKHSNAASLYRKAITCLGTQLHSKWVPIWRGPWPPKINR